MISKLLICNLKKKKYSKFLFLISFLYICLYLPLAFTIYTPHWYDINVDNQRMENANLDKELINGQINDIVGFFLHKNSLNGLWSDKEILHLYDVRHIYDFLFAFFLIFAILFVLTFNIDKIKKYSLVNILFSFSLLSILPFFVYFWDKIFHLLMFRNSYWIIDYDSMFYYMFPYSFFSNSLIFIIIISIFINLIIYLCFSFIKKFRNSN